MTKSNIKLGKYAIVTLSVWAVSVVVIGGGYVLLYQPQKIELAQVRKQSSESQAELNAGGSFRLFAAP